MNELISNDIANVVFKSGDQPISRVPRLGEAHAHVAVYGIIWGILPRGQAANSCFDINSKQQNHITHSSFSQSVQRQRDSITLHDLYHCIYFFSASPTEQFIICMIRLVPSYLIKCFISGAMEPTKEKKAHATTLYILSGVAREKQFQLLYSRLKTGKWFCRDMYAPLRNVCKNMNFCVFIICSSSIVL